MSTDSGTTTSNPSQESQQTQVTSQPVQTSPQQPSPLRDKSTWATIVILPLIGALALLAAQGAWGWISDKVSGPPGLEVYSAGPDGCVPQYSESSLAELKKNASAATTVGVPVTNDKFDPVEIPLTLQARTDEAIVVTGVKVRALSDQKLPARGVIVEPTGCGGGMTKREFDVKFRFLSPCSHM